MDLGIERAGFKCVGQIEKMKYALKVLKKHWSKIPKHTDISTFCVQAGHVKAIQSLVKERECKTEEADSGKKWQGVCDYLSQNGFLAKMFPDFYPLMGAKTFSKCYQTSWKSGMAYRGEYLTVNTLESPRDADVCSLSDVLEDHVPQKYYLSKKAVSGMIRRSKKWGRGGYVYLQEKGKDKTPQLKLLSLQQLEKAVNLTPQQEEWEETLSPTQSEQASEELLAGYGKTLILRKLTPNEKEKVQGLPVNWTRCEE